MRRGLMAWSEADLPRAVLEERLSRLQAGVGKCLACAAGGDQFNVEPSQAAGEVGESRFVSDTEESAANHSLV